MSRITVVDEQDNIIGYKERSALSDSDIYRVAGLWATNDKGEALIARRALTKSHNPGKWGPTAAGTVEEGEDYEQNIIKEAQEELGIKNLKPTFWFKVKPRSEGYRYFGCWYKATVNIPIEELVLQPDEVAEAKWITIDRLKEEVQTNPEDFIPSLASWVRGGFSETGD